MMDTNNPKPWWASKTILAAIGVLIVTLLSAFGIETGDGDGAAIGEALGSIAIGVLSLVTIYGRLTATQKIGA